MEKIIKKILIFTFIILTAFTAAHFALAEDLAGLSYGEGTGLSQEDPRIIAANIIRIALGFLGIIAVSLMIYAGWLWMTAAGNEENIEKAKKILTGAVIGLLIIFSAFGIVSFLMSKFLEATGGGGGNDDGGLPPGCVGAGCFSGSSFYVSSTNPEDGETDVFRNVIVTAFFSRQINDSVIAGDSNFKVEKIANIAVDADTGEITETAITAEVVTGAVSLSEDKKEINFKPSDACGGDSAVLNCFDAYGKFRVTVNSDSGIISASDQALDCSADKCVFEFSTSNAVDDGNPIITGLGPAGGFCKGDDGAATNDPCVSDGDCLGTAASKVCDLNTPNGAAGNFVTISGYNFGSSIGQIYFAKGNAWVEAKLADDASTGNPLCADSVWQDEQIIAVMPAGLDVLATTTIKVISSAGYEETNRDNHGDKFNFITNTIERPGVCKLDPETGSMNVSLNYYGVKLTGNKAYFGSLADKIEGTDASFTTDKQGSVKVPNIQAGQVTTFVLKDKISSNFLNFTKEEEPYAGPYITSFDATEGASGQYVTIRGGGFGHQQGLSKVFFGDATNGIEASYDFPAVCADSVWSANQIIIKVPASISNGDYKLTVSVGAYTADTTDLAPSSFTVDSSLSLTPSLCRMEPITGQNNEPISLWGEYFGETKSKVSFTQKKEQSGDSISVWKQDDSVTTGIKPSIITTTIHTKAVSGSVKVISSSGLDGNGMNLNIGVCAADADCGGSSVCCPTDSISAGSCKTTSDACFSTVKSCVYEWSFSTGADSEITTASTASCSGYDLNQCNYDKYCPNSPGQCSPNSGGDTIETGSCDYYCNDKTACKTNKCDYKEALNKCVIKTNPACELPKTDKDINQSNVAISCVDGKWEMATKMSCPTGWTSVVGGKCTKNDAPCNSCSTGFECVDDDDSDIANGLCVVNEDICPTGSKCNQQNKCAKTEEAVCECCCRIEKSATDCCSGVIDNIPYQLTCQGTCGSDTSETDGAGGANAGFGTCGGCTTKDGGVVNQATSDAKCNCAGTVGKFCDTGANGGSGACVDCAQLSNSSECSQHSTACCVDANNGNACSNGTGYTNLDTNGLLAYCAYYQCDADNQAQCGAETVASSTDQVFKSGADCAAGCQDNTPPGENCNIGTETAPQCSATLCAANNQCLTQVGVPTTADCGLCCCDPNNKTTSPDINESDGKTLVCTPDKSPCGGDLRGLYCGCSLDSQCGSGSTTGCGTDTCCRARPSVTSISPADNAADVCRNIMITAEFDQQMNSETFNNNTLVVGDYGLEACPSGTQYITLRKGYKGSLAVRMADRIIDILAGVPWLNKVLFGGEVYALAGTNYCAIPGSIDGTNLANGNSQLTFAPKSLLDAARTYYIIIKGETDNQDGEKEGVLNSYEVGMSNTASGIDRVFNNITFTGAKIWSFTTINDTSLNVGACQIDSVSIDPSSYLFQTADNDLNEKDSPATEIGFDSVEDRDKVFTATALSVDGQKLTSIAGVYSWNWSWASGNASVLSVGDVTGLADEKTMISVKTGITDGQSTITAKADISDGSSKSGEAEVYVLVCKNPWPATAADGTWSPWTDSETNQQVYYCRDAGADGTADDLPPFTSDAVTPDITDPDKMIKEIYLLSESTPDQISSFTVASTGKGGEVEASWPKSTDGATQYKLYYGTSKGSYSKSIAVASAASTVSQIVSGLENDKTYYFAITSVSDKGAESAYSGEVSAAPTDTTAPAIPADVTAESQSGGSVTMSWTLNTDDTAAYRVYYGVQSGIYGDTVDIDSNNMEIGNGRATTTIAGFSNEKTYYLVIKAIDAYNNFSGASTIASVIVK